MFGKNVEVGGAELLERAGFGADFDDLTAVLGIGGEHSLGWFESGLRREIGYGQRGVPRFARMPKCLDVDTKLGDCGAELLC